ncbi:MAG: hypothetical protein HYW96_00205, partial [Candidatus Wildermuthbacteria bacterium]|nr:hypothetical protein [Candidatus Wildermuthbacteria bacterium]
AKLKILGLDYDIIGEEKRKLKNEFGDFRSPWERFYMWRQQEREELRSTAANGFITDFPLFQFYLQARRHAEEPRDQLAVRELFRMCMEIENRYSLIIVANNPDEIPYKTDGARVANEEDARNRHREIRVFLEHFWPKKLLFVEGEADQRLAQVLQKLEAMRAAAR